MLEQHLLLQQQLGFRLLALGHLLAQAFIRVRQLGRAFAHPLFELVTYAAQGLLRARRCAG
jgi:hypothetical protein